MEHAVKEKGGGFSVHTLVGFGSLEKNTYTHVQKSTSILITRKRRRGINIFLNNKQIEEVSKFKYLAIIIDNKFTFTNRMQQKNAQN